METMATDRIQGDIRYRDTDHSYWFEPTGKQLVSVSTVIATVFAKKSWDGVDPDIIQKAAYRGSTVDRFLAHYIQEGSLTLPVPETDLDHDIQMRTLIAHRIYEDQFGGLPAESQKIVYSLEDGIAGTMDVFVDNRIILDLKSTYSIERSWVLQLGAYASYAPFPPEKAGILHVSPRVYKDTGGRWIEYDVEICKRYWAKAVEWWKKTQELSNAILKRSST